MAELYLIAQLGALRPVDDEGKEFIAKRHGKTLRCEVVEPRNAGHHRKFFAMLNIVLKSQDHYKNIDQLLNVCKLAIGHVEVCKTKHGMVQWPASISWAKMDQEAFDAFYNRAVDWVCMEVIPGLSKGDLNSEVAEQLVRF